MTQRRLGVAAEQAGGEPAPPAAVEAVLAALQEDDVVALAQELVRAPGQNPPGEEEATATALATAATARGLGHTRTEVAPGRPNLTVTLDGGHGPGLLLLGHTDVVPVGDGWTRDPFGGEVAEGRLYGRGATDMKGGLAACLVAMHALGRCGVRLSGPVHLAALADEEQEGIGIRRYVAQEAPALLGCVVAEPTDLQTVIAARGACYLTIDVHGQAAHAGRPSDGRNAIYGAAAVVTDLERWHGELAGRADPLVGPPTVNVGTVHGGEGGSIVAARCRIGVDRRLLPEEGIQEVLAAVRERLARLGLEERGLGWEVTSPMDMPGFRTDPGDPFVGAVDGALADAGGPGLPLAGWTAACDGGFVARQWGVPTVVLGPGSVADQAHRPDESVGVEELRTAARTYALAALNLLAEPL